MSVPNASIKKSVLTRNSTLLLMGVPCFLFIIMFSYVPLFGWVYAFFQYKPGLSLSQVPFTGLKYFRYLFEDRNVYFALRNTLVISFINIAASVIPVIFAIMFSEMRGKYAKKVIQTVTTLPNFISWVVVYGLFFALFSVDGALNNILINLGLITEPTNILGSNSLAWIFQLAAGIWKGTGFGAIIYMAAIAGIDLELYDAADIDGAGRFAKMWYITVPGLMPTFMTLLILSIGNLLSSNFEYFYVFYNPMVHDKIMVLSLYTYKVGMESNNYSYSTAVGMTTSLVSIIILFAANRLSKTIRGNSIF